MKVHLIYAILPTKIIETKGSFAQYDIFEEGSNNGELACVLYAFTTKKSYVKRFFEERPVKRRYVCKTKKVDKEEYEKFRDKNYMDELFCIYLKTTPFTYEVFDFYAVHDIVEKLPEGENPEDYVTRMMTRREFKMTHAHCDDINCEVRNDFFISHPALPRDTEIFVPELEKFLISIGFFSDMLQYHPDGPLEKYYAIYDDIVNGFVDDITLTISIFQAFCYAYYDMIYEEAGD